MGMPSSNKTVGGEKSIAPGSFICFLQRKHLKFKFFDFII